MTESTVTRADAHQRYEIVVDGLRAGLSSYVDDGAQRIFYHTEVSDDFTGQGLASKLTAVALAATRDAGKRIVAVCPLVAAYLDKHDEFDDVADPVTPQAQSLARQAAGG